MESTIYSGTYKDESRELPIQIVNDGYELTFNVEQFKFSTTDLEDWTLTNKEELDDDEIESISLTTSIYTKGFNLVTDYILSDYEIQFSIPQQVLDTRSLVETEIQLVVNINTEGCKLSIELPNKEIIEESKLEEFEQGLKNIIKKMEKSYTLFNCFTCRYSSYSIYGQSFFGSLLCYKNYKENFLKVENKEDYSHVEAQGFESVQETNYCSKFQLPSRGQFLYK